MERALRTAAVRLASALLGARWPWLLASVGIGLLRCADDSPRIRVLQGYAKERRGKHRSAAASYAAAAGRAAAADRMTDLRWLHAAQFLSERALFRFGANRHEDPLFPCALEPAAAPRTVPPTLSAPGAFEAEFFFSGMKLVGVFADKRVGRVDILIDGIKLRSLNTAGTGTVRTFNLSLLRSTLALFPVESILEVRTEGGLPLFFRGRSSGAQIRVPHGSGELPRILASGGKLDKKGVIVPSAEETAAVQRNYVALYARARDFFQDRLGKPLFLTYGSLLGLYRDGGFIKGDDDFDVGYFSGATDPRSVKAETIGVIGELLRAGFSVSFNRRGTLFRLGYRGIGGPGLHLDVRPFWAQGGHVWAHTQLKINAGREDFLPPTESSLLSERVLLPARPETFLAAHYGSGWRTPDSGFKYYLSQVDYDRLNNLAQALITPSEYREHKARFDAERADNPGMGDFVSIGAGEFYPLSGFEADLD